MSKQLQAVSLFSGAGGFELGFERAGIRTVMQVENDPWCLAVLERHWPEVTRIDDVRKVSRETVRAVFRSETAGRLPSATEGSDGPPLMVQAVCKCLRACDTEQADHAAAAQALEPDDEVRHLDACLPGIDGGAERVVCDLHGTDAAAEGRSRSQNGHRPGVAVPRVQHQVGRDRGRGLYEPGGPVSEEGAVDLVYGGWPCQGNSVAGKRAGLSDERSGLWHEVRRVLSELRPRWFVGENVPGLLSVNRGVDFLRVLMDLDKLGYGVAWRTVDARFFGVPQRRRRVFIVGCLGDAHRAAQVLAVCESCGGHPAPGRQAREDTPPETNAGIGSTGCPIDGCDRPIQKRGWCNTHYQRWRTHGDVDAGRSVAFKNAPESMRFWSKVEKTDTCWLWRGALNEHGYGIFGREASKDTVRAHRWAFENVVGQIPDGLDLDHLCRVRHCVRPDHLEPVTNQENTRRGVESRHRAVAWDDRNQTASDTYHTLRGAGLQRSDFVSEDVAPTLDDGARGASVELPMIAFSSKGGGGGAIEQSDMSPTVMGTNGNGGVPPAIVAATLSGGGHPGSNMPGRHHEDDENLVIARSLTSRNERIDAETENFVVASDGHQRYSSPRGDGADNLITGAFYSTGGSHGLHDDPTSSPAVKVGSGVGIASPPAITYGAGVRRLTPLECERLMGWPDGHTECTADGRLIHDSHRYRLCGNGVAAPVAEWIGHRLVKANAFLSMGRAVNGRTSLRTIAART
jgi:site-specific DNA-cytosine methylase